MPYDATNDRYRFDAKTLITQGGQLAPVSASGSDMAGFYPKALLVYVTPGTAGPHVTILPVNNADVSTIALTLNDGLNVIDFVRVRAVTVIASGVTVWRIDD